MFNVTKPTVNLAMRFISSICTKILILIIIITNLYQSIKKHVGRTQFLRTTLLNFFHRMLSEIQNHY